MQTTTPPKVPTTTNRMTTEERATTGTTEDENYSTAFQTQTDLITHFPATTDSIVGKSSFRGAGAIAGAVSVLVLIVVLVILCKGTKKLTPEEKELKQIQTAKVKNTCLDKFRRKFMLFFSVHFGQTQCYNLGRSYLRGNGSNPFSPV